MKEIREIIKAFDLAQRERKQTALATVVQVEGSSYRNPGARMLITEDGVLTEAISGGCLEGDALRKARLAIFQQQSMLVTYDTMDDDDAKFGMGLGCNGIIHILIEPIHQEQENHPIALLKRCLESRKNHVLTTIFNLTNNRAAQIGTCLLWVREENPIGNLGTPEKIIPELKELVQQVLNSDRSLIASLVKQADLTVFVELIKPPVALLVVGAGNDAIPLTELAHIMGWEITVVDGRAEYCSRSRFPKADQLLISQADGVFGSVHLDENTAVVLMTHNYHYDLTVLKQLALSKWGYLGVLGPKKKMLKMLTALEKDGIILPGENRKKLFGPIGLDMGAEAPEEIALATLAEIKTVMERKKGNFLRDKEGPIYDQDVMRTTDSPGGIPL